MFGISATKLLVTAYYDAVHTVLMGLPGTKKKKKMDKSELQYTAVDV